MSESYQYEEKSETREWKRAIPQAGYIKLGALRYGIRISNLNLSDYPQALSTPTPSSLIMSPSSETVSAKAICNDGCCCIGSASSKTRLPMSQSAKNRTSSPSSTSLHQPTTTTNISRSSVSSSNLKREASPTVCCYNINSRSHSVRKSDQSEGNFETFATLHENRSPNRKSFAPNGGRLIPSREQFSYLRDKIRKFENHPNNLHENIINRSTTTIRAEDIDPVKSVGESDRRICDDKNSRLRSTFLINRDENQSKRLPSEKFVSDGNNNQVTEAESDTANSLTSSLTAPPRQLLDTKDINTRSCANGDDIKVTKVVIRHLAPIVVKQKSQVDTTQKPNSLDDNDFSFIDSSSRSVSRSSSASFVSDELGLSDEKVNQRKARIPKIARINSCNNYSREFSVKTGANQNIYSPDQSEKYFAASNGCDGSSSKRVCVNSGLERSKNGQHLRASTNSFSSADINQPEIPEASVTMEKSSRNTLKKFGFGRKSSSSASTSPERKPPTSKTERLRELTEKLKGHKTGSFKINSSRSVSPPVPPPLPLAPVPPPRKLKRNSNDLTESYSVDNLSSSVPTESSSLHFIGKSKSVEPTSIFTRQLKSIQERFLRPNISASNLEALNRSKENLSESQKANSVSLKEDDFFAKLTRPESRTIVGSYTQKNIPFRSASFSQADVTSGKYIKSDLASLRASLALKSKTLDRSPSPHKKSIVEESSKYPLKSELSISIDPEDVFEDASSKRNSDIETITEEPMAESLAERHDEELKGKLAQINVVQANEMTLETLIEEEPSAISASTKAQMSELQQATTCLIPIPVFECVEKEWSPLPEHGGEEFCHPISEDVLPQAKVIENFIEIRVGDEGKDDELDINDNILPSVLPHDSPHQFGIQISQSIPEVELNNVALQLDEITEKLKETIPPQPEVCNVVKTQIPQSKEELVAQKSIDSAEEIRISPEIQEVLETVAETLNEEHKFLTNAIGNANINIVSLICPDQDLSSSDRGTPCGSKIDLLKAADSSPEPGSFDKSDSDFVETVRKRHSNDINSGSEKSSPNASPNINLEDKRKIDKSRRRKGIYIQWPAIEKSQELDSFDSSTADDTAYQEKPIEPVVPVRLNDKKLHRNHSLGLMMPRQSESLCSLEPYTPDSDNNSSRPLVWPRAPRRQSLTYQSSDERDDPMMANSPPLKPFRNIFIRSDSMSDNESDRGSSRDRSTPASANEQDLKRYSKRPLRGPYGQMLEAEMKKPTKVHYDGILEELSRSDSVKKSNCSLDSTSSRGSGFFSRVAKCRKSGGSLPVPMHQRTVSSPVPLIETTSPDSMPIHHKRYPSSVDHRMVDSGDRFTFKHDNKKLSLDSHLSVEKAPPKRTSSDSSDKHSKKNFSDKITAKRSLDEIRMPTSPGDKNYILNTPETPKSMAATPELLAELLKGSSEKLLNEQNSSKKHQSRNISSSGMSLPIAVLNSLNSMDTRTHVVVELFNTEKSYVESLQTIMMKYLNPLKHEHSGLVELQMVDEIFFMVPSILNIHEKFLEELKKRLDSWDPQQRIGDSYYDVFSKPIVLETYSAFVNNWNKAKDAIRTTKSTKPGFAKFLEAMAREHKGKLSLDNLLIKIIQKFPNYELMFQRLIKHTEKDHPDYSGCSEALKLVHDILVQLNCKEREALENGQREATLRELENVIEGLTDLVSSERQFLSFELVSMPSGQAGRKERGFFLFNDLLVISSIKKRSGTYRKPNSVSGSFTSTLDTNKYKFLTKIPLDDLEIVKSKDENVRRIMKEIEHLSEDCSKLQQMSDLASTLRCPHQMLEDAIRELQSMVQKQLLEQQANDTQLNAFELNLNAPSGTQNMSIVFSKPEKRSQWEDNFTEAKQKLIAFSELRLQFPEFVAPVPIRKTRAGLQFTCASPTLGAQKDVWVCNSDGFVGQVCVLSLNQPEPTVTSCNGVCNSRILCVTSVPSFVETNNLNSSINLSNEDNRSSMLSISNASTVSCKTASAKSIQIESGIHLDSSSSSESEPEVPDRPVSPSKLSNTSQNPAFDESESQMWLGTADGYIHVYNCSDNIRIKKNKIKIQHAFAVWSIVYLDNRVFVSLGNGDVCVYLREGSMWNINSPIVLTIGSPGSPVTKLLNVYGKLWCSIQGVIKILNTSTLQIENNVEISSEKPISNMTLLNNHVWFSMQNSATVLCCDVNNLKTVCEVNLATAVNKMLSSCDNIIQQHKAACLRVTSLLACKDIIWVGTSAGVLLTISAQDLEKSSPVVTGITQGHTGQARFLTSVELDDTACSKRTTKHCGTSNRKANSSYMLIISGGDGYEDFRTTGATSLNEVAGREDSTNHLLMWQHLL